MQLKLEMDVDSIGIQREIVEAIKYMIEFPECVSSQTLIGEIRGYKIALAVYSEDEFDLNLRTEYIKEI